MVLRVDPRTVIIFGVMLSPALLVAGELVWHGRQSLAAAALCGLYAAGLYWMCGRTVELAPGRLVYRVMFTRKIFDLSNIVMASIVARPAPTLELRHRGAPRAVPAFIVKPFTRSGVAAILQHVRECSPGVKLDRAAEDTVEGRFDTVTRETIRATNLLRLMFLVVGMLVLSAAVRRLLH